PKMIKTRLKIDRKIFYRILDDFRDDIVEETEDAFIVEKEIEDNRELMLYLLSFADGLTILEPEWLRADYTALLRNMLNRY
ncbi:MAG: WYL domain-containing protein, partial [Clostridia bacterium]|nr:WYL domain-containing protein [Clostridia bacterium]